MVLIVPVNSFQFNTLLIDSDNLRCNFDSKPDTGYTMITYRITPFQSQHHVQLCTLVHERILWEITDVLTLPGQYLLNEHRYQWRLQPLREDVRHFLLRVHVLQFNYGLSTYSRVHLRLMSTTCLSRPLNPTFELVCHKTKGFCPWQNLFPQNCLLWNLHVIYYVFSISALPPMLRLWLTSAILISPKWVIHW